MLRDLRFALKLLAKERAFTAAALLTLALAIGANTAIFSVLQAVVLDPLHYPESEKLVILGDSYPGVGINEGVSNSEPDYFDRRQLTDIFDSVAEMRSPGYDLGSSASSIRVEGQSVTPSFFRVLRATPMLGRAFTEEDATYQHDHFAMLSYGLWNNVFGSDPTIVGKDIRLNGTPYRVTGVMPRGFEAPDSEARLWTPLSFSAAQMGDDHRHSNNYGMIARLKPGVSLDYVQQRLDALDRANLDRVPQLKKLLIDSRYRTQVRRLKDVIVKDVRPILYLLQAAVVFVLLIGCVNVASLLLVRSNVRMREWAVRFSLGASRFRLARQLLTESAVLAAGGGLLGVLVSFGSVRLLETLGADTLPRGGNIAVNGQALAFTAICALLTGLIFGSVPVYHLLKRDLNSLVRSGGRGGTAERSAVWTRSAMVVCQVSLAVVLLSGAGLLSLSFAKLLKVDSGFHPQNVVTAAFSMSGSRYAALADARTGLTELLARFQSIPSVRAVGVTSALPFSNSHQDGALQIEGHKLGPGELPPDPDWNTVSGGYFAAMGIPLVAGRAFDERDVADAPPVVMIDQYVAKRYWPRGDAIGAGIRLGVNPNTPLLRVVGVTGSVKNADLAVTNPQGEIYLPYAQQQGFGVWRVAVKSAIDDPAIVASMRTALRSVDPELAMFDVKDMDERLSVSMRNRKAAMVICAVFAVLALALSSLGIYGVLAYMVTQRTREFGIRMALGANRSAVLGMVMRQGLKLAIVGLFIGAGGALALTRFMTALLFDVKPDDPAVFAVALALLLAVAGMASLIPAARAIRIEPSSALRYE